MKKIILRYGLPTAVIFSLFIWIGWLSMDGETSSVAAMIVGFATMFIALSVMFFAIRKYRQNLGGAISFKDSFLIGLGISILVTIGYVFAWIIVTIQRPEVMDVVFDMMAKGIESKDLPTEEIAEKLQENLVEKEKYVASVGRRIWLTTQEILPIGLLVTLICSLILSTIFKKDKTVAAS